MNFDRFELIAIVRDTNRDGEIVGERPVTAQDGKPFKAFSVSQVTEVAEQIRVQLTASEEFTATIEPKVKDA